MSRIFDLPDGTLIEVFSDKAVRWASDSCQCVLVFEKDSLDRDFEIQVCELHKLISNSLIVSTVLAHNNGFNNKFGVGAVLTEVQKDEIALDLANESARIKALGRPEIRADNTTKDRIETDLRAKGR